MWPRTEPRLLIAGRDSLREVLELGSVPGVEVVGSVNNLDEFLGSLTAGVVPLWRGAGVKLKTLTMMSAAVPLAVTPVGLEGIEAINGVHCLVTADSEGLASHLIRLTKTGVGPRDWNERPQPCLGRLLFRGGCPSFCLRGRRHAEQSLASKLLRR